ncbi:P-loop containing nucleoside triphosphate hydrolase protein [Gloeopeniophorella convolvens]|nr:P-loop containing nucleoside triphosphate hydrolase protein [Gloeopeniophorella convolvens]
MRHARKGRQPSRARSTTMQADLDPLESGAERAVIILVGLIGSGKSTFAEALQEHIPQIRRCNQDELGNRRNVEDLSRSCLRRGLSVCIDRTNFDATQRSHWIDIAHEVPGTAVWVVVLDTPYDVCVARLRNRRYHPTITDADTGIRILSRFASTWEPPDPREGYDKLISLGLAQQPAAGYSKPDVLAVLQRLRDSPDVRINAHNTHPVVMQPSWDRAGRGGSRARGSGRGRGGYYPRARGPHGGSGGMQEGSWRAARGSPFGSTAWPRRGDAPLRGLRPSQTMHEQRSSESGSQPHANESERGASNTPSWREAGAGSAQDPLVLDQESGLIS